MTSFLDFNKDPANDIDNKPQQYHNFGGKGVRVQVYWAADIWRDASLWNNSWALLKGADEILRKYTLALDMLPLQTEPAALAPTKDKATREFDKSVGKQVARQKKAKGEVAKKQTEAAAKAIEEQGRAARGLLDFSGSVYVPMQGEAPIDGLTVLRKSLGTIPDETRLVVVFAHIDGGPNGYTVLRQEWLPWVIVDPQPIQDNPKTLLLHEMGHACRLSHQQDSAGSATARNIMYSLDFKGLTHLWGWQVDTIYDSYWCNGRKPSNWWDRISNAKLPPDHPFLWDEPP
ncbi:hypothetical protein FZC33_10715 [Labrys sp. KNU-23]|uniref:hypothetical protein n=1 Tax=Labrys sp. KNU-23 TaxID=2789216 RepID=UPI0011EE3E89|nr:hypothetical protein [Labrys sp. KNU-23]QEN86769.1 hypothetical protein FZC33_10715 [Labrys sp. KNU-23]